MSNVVGLIVGRIEEMDIEAILRDVQNQAVRGKFIRIFKYMMKDGDDHYLLVRGDPDKTSEFIEKSDKEE